MLKGMPKGEFTRSSSLFQRQMVHDGQDRLKTAV